MWLRGSYPFLALSPLIFLALGHRPKNAGELFSEMVKRNISISISWTYWFGWCHLSFVLSLISLLQKKKQKMEWQGAECGVRIKKCWWKCNEAENGCTTLEIVYIVDHFWENIPSEFSTRVHLWFHWCECST